MFDHFRGKSACNLGVWSWEKLEKIEFRGKSYARLLWFYFTTLSNWSGQHIKPFTSIRFKTKAKRDLLTHIFPRFRPLSSHWFLVLFSLFWLASCAYFSLHAQSKSALSNQKQYEGFIPKTNYQKYRFFEKYSTTEFFMTLMNPGYGFFLFSYNLDLVVFFLWKKLWSTMKSLLLNIKFKIRSRKCPKSWADQVCF